MSAGENDLRILGEIMRVFHEATVLESIDVRRRLATRLLALQTWRGGWQRDAGEAPAAREAVAKRG